MKTIAAALLIALSGKEVTEDGIKNVLKSVNAKANDSEIKNLVASLKGKKPEDVIAEGLKKVAHVGAPAGEHHEEHHEEHKDDKGKGKDKGGKDKGKKEEKKKEEKKKEEEEDDDDFGVGGLF